MKDSDPGFLGALTDVSGARFVARLQDSGPTFNAYREIGGDMITVGQVGAYVIARGHEEPEGFDGP